MEAIILAGGLGTRLREVVSEVPKPMAMVAGRPFLEILLSFLSQQGVSRAVLSVGYRAERISDHFGESFEGVALAYEVEQEPLGTGGAIRTALQQCREDHVLIVNGDTFIEFDLPALQQLWHREREPVIVARATEDTSRYGRLEVSDGRVSSFLEKGRSGAGLINAGAFIIPADLLDGFSPGEKFQFEADFLVQYVKERTLSVYVSEGRFIDIGIPEDYQLAQTFFD